jgi:molybdenum cofactor cytidylyltransferase
MGQPKALLEYKGQTFLERILFNIARSSIRSPIVVLGHDREAILERVKISDWIYNTHYEEGMTTSFQAGIRALPDDATAAMLFLVDYPLVTLDTIEKLGAKASADSIVLPVRNGCRGHPVIFGRVVLDEVLQLPSDRGANLVVGAQSERILEVVVDDPGVLVDVDTPEEFRKLSARLS